MEAKMGKCHVCKRLNWISLYFYREKLHRVFIIDQFPFYHLQRSRSPINSELALIFHKCYLQATHFFLRTFRHLAIFQLNNFFMRSLEFHILLEIIWNIYKVINMLFSLEASPHHTLMGREFSMFFLRRKYLPDELLISQTESDEFWEL